MAALEFITTGTQTVTGTGPVTGVLSTSAITGGTLTLKMKVANLTDAASMLIAIEDTASASAFSDAEQQWTQQFYGAIPVDGDTRGINTITLPRLRIGSVNNALRLNVLSMTGSSSASVLGWLEVG